MSELGAKKSSVNLGPRERRKRKEKRKKGREVQEEREREERLGIVLNSPSGEF